MYEAKNETIDKTKLLQTEKIMTNNKCFLLTSIIYISHPLWKHYITIVTEKQDTLFNI